MKKRTTFGLLGLAAAGAGAVGGMAAIGNYLYSQAILPRVRDPELLENNTAQSEGRLWARAGDGFRSATIQAADGLIITGPTGTNVNDVAVALLREHR